MRAMLHGGESEFDRHIVMPTRALGRSSGTLDHVAPQGTLFRDLTEDVIRRAGIAKGMRVLDVGCGAGDVSLLAGELVGPSGLVLGIDRSAEAVAIAERRAIQSGQCYSVRFAVTELEEFSADESFDAVIGRLILMCLPDPAASLRRLSRYPRPGGIVAFQELSMPMARSIPEGPCFRRYREWIVETFENAGCRLDMGGDLFVTFLEAGLPEPQLIAAGRVEGGPSSSVYDYLAAVMRSLLPMAERFGVTSAAEVRIDTLAERLRAEAVELNACLMPAMLFGAWTRTRV